MYEDKHIKNNFFQNNKRNTYKTQKLISTSQKLAGELLGRGWMVFAGRLVYGNTNKNVNLINSATVKFG